MSLSREVLYCGSGEYLPEAISLRAGPLTMNLVSGQLRNIRLGEREVLRRIYVAVRDPNWRTVPSRLLHLQKRVEADNFQINLEMEDRQGDIHFHWCASISGSAAGSIRFALNGVAKTTFLNNRIGICVLHPIRECAGQACTLERTDGSKVASAFPTLISPHQVFTEVRSIAHEIEHGVVAEVCFEGDTFETEDQRNWSDSSYKTYCPPLSLPRPNQIRAGSTISQAVTLRMEGSAKPIFPRDESAVEVRLDRSPPLSLPNIGVCASILTHPLSRVVMERLEALNLAHLRTELRLFQPDWEMQLRRAAEQASKLKTRLEIAAFVSDDPEKELSWLKSVVEKMVFGVSRWLIFHRSPRCSDARFVALARKYLEPYRTTAKFGGGTNAYFAELNRERPVTPEFDVISTPLNPQVHCSDNDTMAENLEAQGAVIESARHLWPDQLLALGPVTLRPRFAPEANSNGDSAEADEFDVRQMSLFGAAWTAGSLKRISEAGAHSATYYEAVGCRGIMQGGNGPSLPAQFSSLSNAVFPLYHVLADFGDFAGAIVIPSDSSAPCQLESLVLRKGGVQRIVLSNLGSEPKRVSLAGNQTRQSLRMRLLDESSAEWAMNSPESFRATPGKIIATRGPSVEVEVPPFAVATLDPA